MNTRLSQKTISSALAIEVLRNAAEILFLLGIGAMSVLLHAKFKMQMGVPGWYGFIYMAMLITGKLVSKKPYAASLSSVGASLMLLVPLGYGDPLMPLHYLLPGLITDAGFRLGHAWRSRLLLIALICGVSYMSIPLSRIIISLISGLQFPSFRVFGFAGAFALHFVFGFAGGLAGTALFRLFRAGRK